MANGELVMINKVESVNVIDSLDTCWQHQSAVKPREWTQRYIEGKYPPHYPVPAIRDDMGIKDDWTKIGATYIDWSMSRLDWY